MRDVFNDINEGIRMPKLWIPITSLITGIILILLIEYFFYWASYFQISESTILKYENDDHAHVSYLVPQIKNLSSGSDLSFILVGSSSLRESVENIAAIEKMLSNQLGKKVSSFLLASSSQNIEESVCIVNNLPNGKGFIIVGINYTRLFKTKIGENKLLLKSRVIGEYSEMLWERVIKHFYFVIKNYKKRPPNITYEQHNYDNVEVLKTEDKHVLVKQLRSNLPTFIDIETQTNLDLLAELIERGQTRGYEVILLETPNNTELFGNSFKENAAFYNGLIESICQEFNITYIDPNQTIELKNEDFYDLTHLVNSEKRNEYYNAVFSQLKDKVI